MKNLSFIVLINLNAPLFAQAPFSYYLDGDKRSSISIKCNYIKSNKSQIICNTSKYILHPPPKTVVHQEIAWKDVPKKRRSKSVRLSIV